jgi:hypothetical protein
VKVGCSEVLPVHVYKSLVDVMYQIHSEQTTGNELHTADRLAIGMGSVLNHIPCIAKLYIINLQFLCTPLCILSHFKATGHYVFHGAVDCYSADPEIHAYRTPGCITMLTGRH